MLKSIQMQNITNIYFLLFVYMNSIRKYTECKITKICNAVINHA